MRLRKRKYKLAKLPVNTADPYLLVVRVDNGLGYVKTESRTGLVKSAALVALVEAVENVIDIVVRNTLPLVVDRGIDLARLGD